MWRLVNLASQYGIPAHLDYDDETAWESTPPRRLTEHAMSDLRGKIAAVKPERRESVAELLNALTPLTALLVALASIIATCHTHSR
jgi:hypothetical protein